MHQEHAAGAPPLERRLPPRPRDTRSARAQEARGAREWGSMLHLSLLHKAQEARGASGRARARAGDERGAGRASRVSFRRGQNTRAGARYKLNVVNLYKTDSLYNYGMRPLLHSRRRAAEGDGVGWHRAGEHTCYYPRCPPPARPGPARTMPGPARKESIRVIPGRSQSS
jgi:hypothetical protein